MSKSAKRERPSDDVQNPLYSHCEWHSATPKTKKLLDTKVKEPQILYFFVVVFMNVHTTKMENSVNRSYVCYTIYHLKMTLIIFVKLKCYCVNNAQSSFDFLNLIVLFTQASVGHLKFDCAKTQSIFGI